MNENNTNTCGVNACIENTSTCVWL